MQHHTHSTNNSNINWQFSSAIMMDKQSSPSGAKRSLQKSPQNPQAWVGLTRIQCRHMLRNQRLQSIAFAHWLGIPKLGLLLVFKHQKCVEVATIAV